MGKAVSDFPCLLVLCVLACFLRGFGDRAAVRALGGVNVVPLNLVGDQRRATAAAAGWQGGALFGCLRDALLHTPWLPRRTARLPPGG